MLTRRRMLLLSAVTLVGAACGSTEAGLRGSGTVLRRGDGAASLEAAAPADVSRRELATTVPAAPTPLPEPIVPLDALPIPPGLIGTEAEAHVVPVPQKVPGVQPLPAKRLIIPTIGLDSKVIQLGTRLDKRGQLAWETAPFAVGHHRGTAGPGQNGNMVLSGHISSPGEGAIFHHLPELKVGDGVIVGTDERQYLYRVVDTKVVTPDEVSVMQPTPDPTATLITCVPDGIYSHRLVVTARLV
jgi:LPXTG-site transpeptidase (sortase) family protein